MAAVRDEISGEKNLTRAQQHQGTRANVIATLELGPRPGIRDWIEVLPGVARKFISVHQHVAIGEKCGGFAGAAPVVQRSGRCPLRGGWVVHQSAATRTAAT